MLPKNGKLEINGDLSDSSLQGVKAEADLEEEKPLNTLLSPSKKSQEDHKFLHGLGQTEKIANKKSSCSALYENIECGREIKSQIKTNKTFTDTTNMRQQSYQMSMLTRLWL